MPEMPSADMRTMTNNSINTTKAPELITPIDVEGLVMEIKENLRLSASRKALPCSHLSRKSSRASPYRIPSKYCCDTNTCGDPSCLRRKTNNSNNNKKSQEQQEDPYELLQKLLRDGSLVNEAVRRVQLGLTPKQRYFYESDDESSPVLRLYSQES